MISTWRPQIGERVRIRVSAECQYCVDLRYPACADLAISQDGRTATVVQVGHDPCSCQWGKPEYDPEHQAHEVWVRFDEERPTDDRVRMGNWECPFDAHFAPQELEPLDEYICCACAQTVQRADEAEHPCGPCQCPQP